MASQKPVHLISLSVVIALLIGSLSTGCNQPSAAPTGDTDAAKLKKENQDLNEKLEAVTKNQLEAVTLLNDITDKLAEMTGKEIEVRIIQNDLDPSTFEASVDLREQISKNLETLKLRLEEAKNDHRGLTSAAETNTLLAPYKTTIGNLKLLLDEKERTINSMQAEMDALAERADALKEEVDKSQEKINALQQESQSKEAKIAAQDKLIGELHNVSLGYYLIGRSNQIDSALRRGEIKRKWWTYQVTEDVLGGERPPQSFQTIKPEIYQIPLGSNLRGVKVLSLHKRYESMFYAAHDGNEWYLRLKEPLVFWSISRYLIVEVQ